MATKAEPKETSERYIQRQVVTILRANGWFVQIASGSTKAMPGLAGHPDLMATKVSSRRMASILYVECKAYGAKLRPSQEKWKIRAQDLLAAQNVHYAIAEATKLEDFTKSVSDWIRYVEMFL